MRAQKLRLDTMLTLTAAYVGLAAGVRLAFGSPA